MRLPLITGLRLLIITGSLLVALGAYMLIAGVNVHTEGLVSVGPFHSTVQEKHTVPALFGWMAIIGGVLLILAGSRGKRGKR